MKDYTLKARGVNPSLSASPTDSGAPLRQLRIVEGRNNRNDDGRSPSLTKRHISPLGLSEIKPVYDFSSWKGANLTKVTKPKHAKFDPFPESKGKAGKKTKVVSFSYKSRLNLKRKMATIDEDAYAVILTPTYPRKYPNAEDVASHKRHRDMFCKRFDRQYPQAGGIWKLELQKRGAPHYHFVMYGLDGVPLDEIEAWARQVWFEIVGSGDLRHLKHGVDVQAVKSGVKAAAYMAKYVSKEDEGEDVEMGARWGVFNKKNIPFVKEVETLVTAAEASALARYAKNKAKAYQKGGQWRAFAKRYALEMSELEWDTLRAKKATASDVTAFKRYLDNDCAGDLSSFLVVGTVEWGNCGDGRFKFRKPKNYDNSTIYSLGGVVDANRYLDLLLSQRVFEDWVEIGEGAFLRRRIAEEVARAEGEELLNP